MMMPAMATPSETASAVDLMPMSRKLAASVPVHAPVPGMGIPTNSSFLEERTREQEKQLLGLKTDKKYILIAGGSMGGGKIEKTIEELQNFSSDREDVELIVICGSNQKLYQKSQEKNSPGVTVLEHTDRMASYMRASHLFITKPGGLSSTEAAVCHVPILHTSAIPGCES